MAFPPYTNTFHTEAYDSISPTRPELSTAGKVVLITGRGSGIGPRVVHAFAASGATKISILGRNSASLRSTKADVESKYPTSKVLTFVPDIIDKTVVDAAFEATKAEFGAIDIFVSNAAYMPTPANICDTDINEWFHGMEVNVKGNLILSQAFLKNSVANATCSGINTTGAHVPPIPFGLSTYAKAADIGSAVPFDDIELAAGFLVWAASPEAEFLKGKILWSNWDVNDLIEKKKEFVVTPNLTVGLHIWP